MSEISNAPSPVDAKGFHKLRDIGKNVRARIGRKSPPAAISVPVSPPEAATVSPVKDEDNPLLDLEEIAETTPEIQKQPSILPDTSVVITDTSVAFGNTERAKEDASNQKAENELVKELSPRREKDDGGYERFIYTVGEKSYMFRGSEELPRYDTFGASRTTLIGDAPKHIRDEEVLEYKADADISRLQDGPEHFSVTKTPRGVVGLAIALGAQDPSLQKLHTDLQSRQYTEQALGFIDTLLAANYIDEQAGQFLAKPNPHAEALVVMALTGNEDARSILAKKVAVLSDLDRKAREDRIEDDRVCNVEPLRPDRLVAVHATRHRPGIGKNGEYAVVSTFDGSHEEIPRNSIHTALNHKVDSGYSTADWRDTDFMIVSPFESMTRTNGLPDDLNTVDTWWTRNPGEPLIFSDATLVVAGKPKAGELIEMNEDATEIRFKRNDYTASDLSNLKASLLQKGEYEYSKFAHDINDMFFAPFSPGFPPDGMRDLWQFDSHAYHFPAADKVVQYLYGDPPDHNNVTKFMDTLALQDGELSLEDAVRAVVKEAGLESYVADQNKTSEALDVLVGHLTRYVSESTVEDVGRLAVEKAIKIKGFEVQPGGDWAWGGSWDVTAQTIMLAKELGVSSGSHSATPESQIIDVYGSTTRATKDEKPPMDWKRYDPSRYNDLIPSLDQRARRMLYASGLLVARGVPENVSDDAAPIDGDF